MSKHLSIDQRIQVVLKMARLQSVTLVQREWRKEFSQESPTDKTITSIYSKFLSTGSVHDVAKPGRPKEVEEGAVIQHFENQPSSSVRVAAIQLGVGHSSIHRALTHMKMRPYHIQLVQQLHEIDYPARRVMCEQLLNMFSNDESMLENLCFSDEATFFLSPCINKHNCRIWGYENPHLLLEVPLHSPKVNVWMAVFQDRVIGPYFFEGNVTSESYMQMLQEYFLPTLGRLHRKSRTIFQQDGAPPHWSLQVREFLNRNFPGRWIGRDGPIHWAARSPELSPLDFFAWGFLKEHVYKDPIADVEALKDRIQQSVLLITKDMLENTFINFLTRLQLCLNENGAQFQHLL
jgi:hypothetical protein